MHKFALGLAALGLLATPVLAQAPLTFADVDADGNGELSFVELQLVWPDLTQAEFDVADIDLSGGLNADELTSLQPGAVPVPDTPPSLSLDDAVPQPLVDTKDD